MTRQVVHVVLLAIALIALVRTAWISDDALITVRSALNFVYGYGPTFNLDERVQGYTHPLWFLIVSAVLAVSRNAWFSLWLLSFTFTLAGIHLLQTRLSRQFWTGVLAVSALLTSKAYLDYAASGLENPLAHLLLAIFVLQVVKAEESLSTRSLTIIATVASLIYLTRPDLLLLIAPAVAWLAWRSRRFPRRVARAALIGALPAVIWTLLSLYYYGFPFPNTAYAKLGAGIPRFPLIVQGGAYLIDSVTRDVLTLPVTGIGVWLGIRAGGVDRWLALGTLLYLAYVVTIGGDFMTGRFLTAPLMMAAILLARTTLRRAQLVIVATVVALLALFGLQSTLLSSRDFSDTTINAAGIADERGYYFQPFGLIAHGGRALTRGSEFNPLTWDPGEHSVFVICGGLGAAGVRLGPGVHLVDECGLTDPLLARLPARDDPNWRIGHFYRQLPTDYLASVSAGENRLFDPPTREYYEVLRRITRGPLLSRGRWLEILRINTGMIRFTAADQYRRGQIPRSSAPITLPLERVGQARDAGTWDAPGHVVFDRVAVFTADAPLTIRFVDLSVDFGDRYLVEALIGVGSVELFEVAGGSPPLGHGLTRYRRDLPAPIVGVTGIRVTALEGDGRYSLGHLIVR